MTEARETELAFHERRYADFMALRYPQFWQRFGGVPDFAGKRVIDFGCARGGMLQRAMEAGASSALGIDLNPDTIAFAKQTVEPRWDGRVQFLCEDIRKVEIEPADILVSVNTMEHVLDLKDTLAAVVDACKPGGELFIGFGPLWHSPFGHHRLIAPRMPWAHLPRQNRAFLGRLHDKDGNTPDSIEQMGFNGATPADFRAALEGLPVEIISSRRNVANGVIKGLAMKAFLAPSIIAPLEKYVTISIYWHLKRTKSQV